MDGPQCWGISISALRETGSISLLAFTLVNEGRKRREGIICQKLSMKQYHFTGIGMSL